MMRRIGLVAMLLSVVLLIVVVARRDTDQGIELVSLTDVTVGTPTPKPTITPTPNPFQVTAADGSITIRRLSSPVANSVRAEGSLAESPATAAVTADGKPVATIEIVAQPTGSFEVDIFGLMPGPQEVCIADACQRVLVSDTAPESRETVEARINDAIDIAAERFDIDRYLPDWTIEIGGRNSATGGTAVVETKQLLINANPGRTLDDYVVTVLHEVGHAIDAEYLTDAGRDRFRALRGHAPELPWGIDDTTPVSFDRWRNSAEDFAEVFVAWTFDGDYAIESTVVAPQPNADQLTAFCELIALPDLSCS